MLGFIFSRDILVCYCWIMFFQVCKYFCCFVEKCMSVGIIEKMNKLKYVKYDKKMFFGIIVVVVVFCIVVILMVWFFIQYNIFFCGKKVFLRRCLQYVLYFELEFCDEVNVKVFEYEGISYIFLKLFSLSSI